MKDMGNPKDFIKMNFSSLLLRMTYPSILVDLANQMEIEEVMERLYRIGKKTGIQLFDYYKVKGNDIEKIIKNILKKIWNAKAKIIRKKDSSKLLISLKNCPICGDLPPLELEDVHYCAPVAGFIVGYLDELSKIRAINCKPGTIKARTIQSVCSSETKTCVHELIITGGTDFHKIITQKGKE